MSHENKEFPELKRPKDFGVIRNFGSISQWKNDIYGNQYALFKISNKIKGLGGVGADGFSNGDGSLFATSIGGLLGLDENANSKNTNNVDTNDQDPDDGQLIGFNTEEGCYIHGDADKCEILDGHVFNDPIDGGINFDYSIVETNYENQYWIDRGLDDQITTNRSGVTGRTIETDADFLSAFNIDGGIAAAETLEFNARVNQILNGEVYGYIPCDPDVSSPGGQACIAGQFIEYRFCLDIQGIVTRICTIKDGGGFTQGDNDSPLDETYSSDLSSWPDGAYYYAFLAEAGLNTVSPLQVPLRSPNLPGNFTEFLSASDSILKIWDGDVFGISCADRVGDTEGDSTNKVDNPNSGSSTTTGSGLTGDGTFGFGREVVESIFGNLTKGGLLYFKDIKSTEVILASAALANIYSKYPPEVKAELDHLITNIDIVYDIIFLETANYFVYDKIIYDTDEGIVLKPLSTRNYVYLNNPSPKFHKMSNPFFLESESRVYFAEIDILETLSATNSKILFPIIKSVDVTSGNTKKEYPTFEYTFENLQVYSLSGSKDIIDVNIVEIEKPVLSHNTRNQLFTLSYIGKDLNNIPYIFTNEFKVVDSKLELQHANFYKTDLYTASVNFNDNGSQPSIANSLSYYENLGTVSNTTFIPITANGAVIFN